MGKLSDLWAELKVAKPEDKDEIKAKINSIEQWCIDKGFGGIKELTDWTKPMKSKKKKDGFVAFNFENDKGFCMFGNMILPKHQFCKCGIYTDNDLIRAKEGFITWRQ